jgi:type IV secretory pathway VirB2 component (pilin)
MVRAWLGLTALSPLAVSAQGFGPLPAIPGAPGTFDKQGIRDIILRILYFVLDFLALIAVVFIVIAGIRLLVSQGNDEQKDKAKKTILYVVIGLLVILFARVIVGFFTETVPNSL